MELHTFGARIIWSYTRLELEIFGARNIWSYPYLELEVFGATHMWSYKYVELHMGNMHAEVGRSGGTCMRGKGTGDKHAG